MKWNHDRLRILILAAVAFQVAGLRAATYEVGKFGQPFATITGALDQLYADVGTNAFTETQTINVHAGTYSEQVMPPTNLNATAANRLVIQANPGDRPVVDGGGVRTYGFYINRTPNYVTVRGFEVINCQMGIVSYYSPNDIIESNIIHNCSGGGGESAWGIYVRSLNTTVRYNIAYSNNHAGIWVHEAGGSSFVNNTCYNNGGGTAYYEGGIRFHGAAGLCKNNICADNSIDFSGSASTNLYNCSMDSTAPGTGCLTNVDPYFVNIGTSLDFTLLSNSVCRGAGEGGVNMGAYYNQSSFPYAHTQTTHTVKAAGGGDYTNITECLAETGPQRVMAGETINVYNGTYIGPVTIQDRNGIILRAAAGQKPVITSAAYGVYLSSSCYVTIAGLEIAGGTIFGIK